MNKHWLPWLTQAQRASVATALSDVVHRELVVRHWGAKTDGKLSYDQPKFLVTDIRGVAVVSGVIRYHLFQANSLLFYRGQTHSHSLFPSVFRTPAGRKPGLTKVEQIDAISWLDTALATIAPHFDPVGDADIREALAQHYGMKTRWLDIVDHFQMAAWFAYDAHVAHAEYDLPDGLADDSVGYVYLVASPRAQDHRITMWRDLRVKPSNWLRPHVQQGFSIRLSNPHSYTGSLDGLVVCQLVVPRGLLRQWSAYDGITRSQIYPGLHQDDGQLYWTKAQNLLKGAAIPNLPPLLRTIP